MAGYSPEEKAATRAELMFSSYLCLMWDYQLHRPPPPCQDNVSFLYAHVLFHNPDSAVKAKAVWCVIKGGIKVHMVLDVEGEIMDPTYEVNSSKESCYYDTVKEIKESTGLEIPSEAMQAFMTCCEDAYTINSTPPQLKLKTGSLVARQAKYIKKTLKSTQA